MRFRPWNDAILVARAKAEVSRARRSGELTPQPCQKCGSTEKVEAHHEDYSKPLEITWLCNQHHRKRHSEINLAFKIENGLMRKPPVPKTTYKYDKVREALAGAVLSVEDIGKVTGLGRNEIENVLTILRRGGAVKRRNKGVFMYALSSR